MPAFNESESIEAAVTEVVMCVLSVVRGADLWVIDDGSRDRTSEILDRLTAADSRLHTIHQPNRGHGAAVLTGLAAATGDWILIIDSDRQIPLDNFETVWERRQGFDALFGRRLNRHDPFIRKVISTGLKVQLRIIFHSPMADANAPFKLISRRFLEASCRVIPADCLIPSVFLSVYAQHAGFRYALVDVPYRGRAAGTTSLRKVKLLKFSARSLAQLIAFKRALARHRPALDLSELSPPTPKKP